MIDIEINIKRINDSFIVCIEGEGQNIELIKARTNEEAREVAKELRLELARQVMILAFQELRESKDNEPPQMARLGEPLGMAKVEKAKPKTRKPRAKKQAKK